MKILFQLSLIMVLCLLGELLAQIIPFPIPGTILALCLLFILLKARIIKLSWIQDVGDLLLKNMALLFVPAGVKIMAYFGLIKDIWWKLLLVSILITVVTFLSTAFVVTAVMKLTGKEEKR